ncbi:DUF169 domain-containing protein [Enterococcus sp. ALS3]|uniref:DUF169 domain-containing protein n=1 Tax=Enterococcus alishanensis TaxID=1303817 RepID=A0ABS6THR5_9ENTE|nr:DUF169 domain-containing protein [Enterococcus alishanensis]MBV7392426.1 DUF169 domain-containing protein [Enterococcus alishanensis]
MNNYLKLNQRLNTLLNLERKIVGVTFLKDEETFKEHPATSFKNMMPYCQSIKKATEGYDFKLTAKNFACLASAVAMGLIPNDDYSSSGRKHTDMGCYQDIDTSKSIADDMVYVKEKNYGVAIQPIEKWQGNPDVVVLITTPFNAMRMIQGNAYFEGQLKNIKLAGMQAICQEATSYPFVTDQINISMMCSGTRYVAQWKDEELAIGVPFNKFEKMIRGIEATLNPMELREKKKIIEEKLTQTNNLNYDVKKNQNYFKGAYTGIKK